MANLSYQVIKGIDIVGPSYTFTQNSLTFHTSNRQSVYEKDVVPRRTIHFVSIPCSASVSTYPTNSAGKINNEKSKAHTCGR